MKLNLENRAKLIDEIKFVLQKMKEASDPQGKLYYFSAVYGVMNRIFNLENAPDLIFAHFVISATHAQINARLHDPDKTIQIPSELFEKLYDATAELLDVIEKNKSPYEVLRKFALLGYVTVGNGYYLYEKKMLKI